jgi:hypothetical protein
MSKFEITEAMLNAAEQAYDTIAAIEHDAWCYTAPTRAAISAAIESSGLVEEIDFARTQLKIVLEANEKLIARANEAEEENARLRIGLRYLIEHVEEQNSSWDVMAISHAKAALDRPTVKQNLTVQPTKESK